MIIASISAFLLIINSLVPKTKSLNHIGIILDGNRRWAKKHILPTLEGHRRGYNKVKKVADWCIENNINILTVYAFSTENWNRSKNEVNYLLNLLRLILCKDVQELIEKKIKVKFIGQIERLSDDLQKLIANAEQKSKKGKKMLLQICLSYGGRPELVQVVKKIVKAKIPINSISEKTIGKYLWTNGVPDPDLIIRTSGEKRLSNFLTWQGAYSELYFTDVHWPAFSKNDLQNAITEFYKRYRRYGK